MLMKEDLKTRRSLNEIEKKFGRGIYKNQTLSRGKRTILKNELTFYSKLFELLIKYKIDNLLFSVSKMLLLIDSK